ncbi:MAG: histidinol-phosphatase, partial [Bacteroidota bacterium]|nr:histidinol-phosphatase [Bacteroidota bacterium]
EDSNTGRGWVMVNCKKLATEDIILAMEKGDFYASTGVHLKKLFTDKKQIEIEVDPESGVIYEIIFIGYQKGAEDVVELKKVIGKSASYTFKKEDVFVRVRINSDAKKDNPIIKDETKKAWTQPFLVE